MIVNADEQGRMLLSHNFDVSSDQVPALSNEEFVTVFQTGLRDYELVQCRGVNHPHWIVEICFPADTVLPSQVGAWCAEALAEKRRSQGVDPAIFPDILILGGIKTTPPTSDSPDALQPGEWGVDVVETRSGETFLQVIGWQAAIAQKDADSVFKVEWMRED